MKKANLQIKLTRMSSERILFLGFHGKIKNISEARAAAEVIERRFPTPVSIK
jgi:hypothetical protein